MNPATPQCSCAKFERLEGAATQAYILQFLHKTGADDEAVYYQCRVCEIRWQKVEEAKRPSLVKVK